MKKLITFIVSGFLLVGTYGCEQPVNKSVDTSKTPSTDVKNTTKSTDKSTIVPVSGAGTKTKIKTEKTSVNKADAELQAAISKKLETGLPGNKLVIENNNGEVTIKGIATSKAELAKAEKLVKEVKGVKSVTIEAQIKAKKNS